MSSVSFDKGLPNRPTGRTLSVAWHRHLLTIMVYLSTLGQAGNQVIEYNRRLTIDYPPLVLAGILVGRETNEMAPHNTKRTRSKQHTTNHKQYRKQHNIKTKPHETKQCNTKPNRTKQNRAQTSAKNANQSEESNKATHTNR